MNNQSYSLALSLFCNKDAYKLTMPFHQGHKVLGDYPIKSRNGGVRVGNDATIY